MSLQTDTTTRNAILQAMIDGWGANPILELRTGAPPASVGAADTGTLLASMALGASPMAAPANGSAAKNGTWEDLSANNAGDPDPGHFRIKTSGGVVKLQGTVTDRSSGISRVADRRTAPMFEFGAVLLPQGVGPRLRYQRIAYPADKLVLIARTWNPIVRP